LLVICPVGITAAFILIFAKFDTSDVFKGIVKPLIVCMCAVLLIAPALWSLTPLIYHTESMIPYAGPDLDNSRFMKSINLSAEGAGPGTLSMGSFMGSEGSDNLTSYLMDHWNNETYLVAVPSATMAAGIILSTGMPVMAVGGFLGSDPILTADRLEEMVEDGEVRYFMTTGDPGDSFGNNTGGMPGLMGSSQSEINSWVKEHGTLVPTEEWSDAGAVDNAGGRGMAGGFGANQLYDLKSGR
jgi:4-amino-4-deoxy-L-arabinose transferase-like glycosyltransferase